MALQVANQWKQGCLILSVMREWEKHWRVIREMEVIPTRVATMKKIDIPKCWWDYRTRIMLRYSGERINYYSCLIWSAEVEHMSISMKKLCSLGIYQKEMNDGWTKTKNMKENYSSIIFNSWKLETTQMFILRTMIK